MNSIHYSVKQAILPVLLETTGKARDITTIKHPQAVIDLALAYKEAAPVSGFSEHVLKMICAAVGHTEWVKAVEEVRKRGDSREVLSVLKHSKHGTIIVIHSSRQHFLSTIGTINTFANEAILGYASDEEVEQCVDNLTPEQIKYILKDDLFAPAIMNLLNTNTDTEKVEAEP